ncbi:helix-turn-helix transcriptional regulator [Xanthomonas cucurbitae]|uniref:Helix-turn-helix transcriptional regulator n=1 Tax=Xanthomonas cucurbitae TaxID=56453 RepID=A0A2S7DXJ2_9XANT|nr:helix-turn-helix transcriptional regulator [Xanthomonas cucurbitae]PPU78511.1 hypothetical protein XcuCFBP2542_02165 [Xanthomonas cucurbitae]WDM67653.1 helix-turn-helix transcriptional regulator [Xanthomonas cucurbitae]WDM71529.1 helix-turn-helix transcriptional regulator [Xanthomonas cucurbitae]WDM79082.1 helix-turn-helix transcriptional regulator [Xanthomonas cucurbitae]WDM82766.1 helix-turn-helix transcriptional regulator [Xanthomonas cucurbitae]
MDTVRTPSDIGNVIRARRKHLGWDQARLAKQIGVSRQWIVDIEKGKPRAELQLILRALHVLGLQLALSPGAAQAQEREMLDPIPAASINLDAILERHRGTLPPGTGVAHPSNSATPRSFSALSQQAFKTAYSTIDTFQKRHPAHGVLKKQFSVLDEPKVVATAKKSAVTSASKKKDDR